MCQPFDEHRNLIRGFGGERRASLLQIPGGETLVVCEDEGYAGQAKAAALPAGRSCGTDCEVRIAHQRGALVVLDTSGPALSEAIGEKPDVIKINSHELAGLADQAGFASDRDLVTCARSIAIQIGGSVIVTRGAESTVAIDLDGTAWGVGPARVERAVSPIGCGDSFAAGVAVAMTRGMPFTDVLVLGTACALANLETAHAAHFERGAVDRWRTAIQVHEFVDAV